ncbi:MAG TPA: hypothetical protein VMT76_11025 [Puia sp.]|nr:hypothetical protein [Puia sp.]
MYSYALLERNCYYLIREKEESPIELVKINFETDYCLHVSKLGQETILEWRMKTDAIHDILELLDDDKVKEWQTVQKDNEGSYNYEEDEE